MSETIFELEEKMDRQEQYSRKNYCVDPWCEGSEKREK